MQWIDFKDIPVFVCFSRFLKYTHLKQAFKSEEVKFLYIDLYLL